MTHVVIRDDVRIRKAVAETVETTSDDTLQFFLTLDACPTTQHPEQSSCSSRHDVAPRLDEPHKPQGLVRIHDDRPSWGHGPRRSKKVRK